MDRELPDREQLLGEIFDIVRQHQPVKECTLMEIVEESRKGTPEMDVSIALCMLQARGMVRYFSVQANPEDSYCRRKLPNVDFMYSVIEQEAELPETPEQDTRAPGLWSRIFG